MVNHNLTLFVLYSMHSHTSSQYEQSITLDHYLQIGKKETLALKKLRKEEEKQKPPRKHSTQMSIVTWLTPVSVQKSAILALDKCLIVKIFGYLRLSELVVASRVCEYFHSCYKSLWTDKEFFGQLETDKFTSEELGNVIKLSRLDHIRPLKQIYSGKNLRFCREKFKIKAGSGVASSGGMLQIFSVCPKNPHSGSTFIIDSHLTQIVSSSYRSLKVIELVKCGFLQNFNCLSKCINLTRLVITYNDNFDGEDLKGICKRCMNLEQIWLESCRGLDENVFEMLRKVEGLENLTLKFFRQNFSRLGLLAQNANLKHLDLEGSLINDVEACQISKLPHLTYLSLKNCILLTDSFLDWLISYLPKTRIKQVVTNSCGFDQSKIAQIETILQQN